MAADIFFDAKGRELSRQPSHVAGNFLVPLLLPFGHDFLFRN
jgi:hypothetical protein